jgi:DNA-binding transcriptional MocR family regulator
VLEIAFHPDRTGEVALVHQLTQHLAGLIETGRLVAGCKLPATREAAAALRREMPPGTRWTEPRSGHLVWITLPPGIDPDRLEQAARDRGVGYTRGETFHVDGRGRDSLALSFAPLDPRAIAEGVARLGAAVRAQIAIPRAPRHVRPAAVRSGRGRRPAGRRAHDAR